MFIKWRTYQRQDHGKKYDKFIHQGIIVESYRRSKNRIRKTAVGTPMEGMIDMIFETPEFKNQKKYPVHHVIWKLPSYPACMVVYFRSPHWMRQRLDWWEGVDMIFKKLSELRDDMPPMVVDKLKAELEAAVPRVTPEEVAGLM